MKKKTTFFQSIDFKIIFVFIVLLLVALELIGTYFVRQLETQLVTNFQEEKRLQVGFLDNTIQPMLLDDETAEDSQEIARLIEDFSGNGILEVQIIDAQHYVLGTSDRTQQNSVGSKTSDKDVHQALLLGNTVTSQYKDQATNDRIWKLVSPIVASNGSNEILGVIALTTNIESVYEQISEITLIFLNSSLVAVAVTVILALFISRAITKPITEMTQQTIQMAYGDYSGQVKVYSKDELGILSTAIHKNYLEGLPLYLSNLITIK